MNLVLSFLLHFLKTLVMNVNYDAFPGPGFIIVGLIVLIIVGIGIIALIIFAVRRLRRINKIK
jgi:hypothetical protein